MSDRCLRCLTQIRAARAAKGDGARPKETRPGGARCLGVANFEDTAARARRGGEALTSRHSAFKMMFPELTAAKKKIVHLEEEISVMKRNYNIVMAENLQRTTEVEEVRKTAMAEVDRLAEV